MRRHGNLYEKITSSENIKLAYVRTRKGKTWQQQVRTFDLNIEENLKRIQEILINKAFKTSVYRTKRIHEPKERVIYIVPFSPDRIVHHALMNILEPIYKPMFIHDSYACIEGKGLHGGSQRTMEFVRANKYCLKCDISKFYPSIKHDILFNILKRKIKCKDTLGLIKAIIYGIGGGQNVPIGNYTSQWFGNIYLNELDQHAKHIYKIKHYIRYCDDFVFFHNDKAELRKIAKGLKVFLDERLGLKMSKCELFPVSQGVDFLGYRHFPRYVLLRKSTAIRVKRRLKILPRLFEAGRINFEYFRSCIASYTGWMRWANCHNLGLKLQMDRLQEILNVAGKATAQAI
jgi:retron-type reverse transcriptase